LAVGRPGQTQLWRGSFAELAFGQIEALMVRYTWRLLMTAGAPPAPHRECFNNMLALRGGEFLTLNPTPLIWKPPDMDKDALF